MQHNWTITRKSMDFHGQTLTVETGRIAKQANGSVLITMGDNILLVTAAFDKNVREGQDFFPLTVEFIEKMYAAGKIPGGFFKREAKPSTWATLNARLIDRCIRPMFPEGFLNPVQIVVTCLSYDGTVDVGSLGIVGASLALTISDIPFAGPIAGVTVGFKNGEVVINPDMTKIEDSMLELNVAGSSESIVMIEAGAKEISEDDMNKAVFAGHEAIKNLCAFQTEFAAGCSKAKMDFVSPVMPAEIVSEVNSWRPAVREAFNTEGKFGKQEAIDHVLEEKLAAMEETMPAEDFAKLSGSYKKQFEELVYNVMRDMILDDGIRADKRGVDQIRPISIELDLLPRAHGSALFTRGETQSIGIATLGTPDDEQIIDTMDDEYRKRYFLHYNFPPFSVGEVGRLGTPGRRELGHGALAERALLPVLPPKEKFPYTIRMVSEITESNGSSSMASVCSCCLAMMAGGVTISKPVAGIANGLIMRDDKFEVLTDIQGLEDHLGDMDFKVTGTRDGITAMQMDIKIKGISQEIMQIALAKAKVARNYILDLMQEAIAEPRTELSPYAPRIETIAIPQDKISEVIGTGGKTIKSIIEETKVSIDIQDDGTAIIASPNLECIAAARSIIKNIIEDPIIGQIYTGVVNRIEPFGAFVKFMGNKTGMVHVSQMAKTRVEKADDMVKLGDTIQVKFIGLKEGKISLSMRLDEDVPPEGERDRGRGDRGRGFGDRDRGRGFGDRDRGRGFGDRDRDRGRSYGDRDRDRNYGDRESRDNHERREPREGFERREPREPREGFERREPREDFFREGFERREPREGFERREPREGFERRDGFNKRRG